VRPSVASLNSLAAILRQATPLYAECRLILDDLDRSAVKPPAREGSSLSDTEHSCDCPDGGLGTRGLGQVCVLDTEPAKYSLIDSTRPAQTLDVSPPYAARKDLNDSQRRHQTSARGTARPETTGILPQCPAEPKAFGTLSQPLALRANPSDSSQTVEQSMQNARCSDPDNPSLPHRSGTSRAPKSRTIICDRDPLLVSRVLMSRYNREALYEKVWTVTVRELAKEYGVSDVAMGKTCRKLHIPVPGRGYWAKKAANAAVDPRPPLPKVQIR
jgi:hypothetical protein